MNNIKADLFGERFERLTTYLDRFVPSNIRCTRTLRSSNQTSQLLTKCLLLSLYLVLSSIIRHSKGRALNQAALLDRELLFNESILRHANCHLAPVILLIPSFIKHIDVCPLLKVKGQ